MKKLCMYFIAILCAGSVLYGHEVVESKFKATLYGFVKLETIYDSTEVARGDWLLFAHPGKSVQAAQAIFTMNARHSRIGLQLGGPKVLGDGQVKGQIEVDFAGGFPNSSTASRQPQLRLRHAWAEINKPGWELRLGQDWALISGPFPNTTSFVVGAGKGNLWMRYPQIKYTWKKKSLKLAVSMNRPMAGNIKYEDYSDGDFDPIGDGERSGMPWWMARAWLNIGKATVSVSGHYGREEIEDLSGMAHDMNTYSINADIQFKTGPLSLTARTFIGENLNSFFGGVFQGFTRDSRNVTNVSSKGGWAQAVYQINDQWGLTLGGGLDNPDNADLNFHVRDRDMRSCNEWIFGNVTLNFSKSLIFMLETEYLKTSYLDSESGDNLRLQFVTYLKF